MNNSNTAELHKLIDAIKEAQHIVFFGGAGVSTESGIPDFRSKDGLYNQHDVQFEKYQPEYLLSRSCLYNNPKVFYEFYRQKMDVRGIEPNITHKVLAKIEQQGKLDAVITQNIDGLHQKAGSKNVYEIHGTTLENYCGCTDRYPSDYLFTNTDDIPKCSKCHKLIRPKVTLYGEDLPSIAVNKSIEAIKNADLLIIGGTSLSVYPACTYITYLNANSKIVIINRDVLESMNDYLCEDDICIVGSLGEVFTEIDKALFGKCEK